MPITVAELRNVINVELNPLKAGAAQAESILQGLGTRGAASLGPIGQAFEGLSPLAATAAAGIAASLIGAVALIGKAAFDAAVEFDTAFDKIRVATGATGEKLNGLQDSFRTLFTSLPTTSAAASEALSFLNARLGLTGKGLEDLAKQELELSRITGSALGPQLEATTKVFNKWQISTENQSGALDYLFKVSQQTAVSVTDLSRSLVQSAGPLQDLGFSFEQAAVLVGKFTAEGIDTSRMTIGLKQALANMAKEGVTNAGEAFTTLIDRIKNTQNPMAQLDLAVKTFGRRIGEDMVQAIRTGGFDLDQIKTKIDESKETINNAAEATNDYAESWTTLKNKVTEEIEPLGKVIFDGLTAIVTTFTGTEQEINKRWSQLWADLSVSSKEGADSIIESIVKQLLLGEDPIQAAGRRLGEAFINAFDNAIKAIFGIEGPTVISNPLAKAREKINWGEEQTKWGGEGWKVGQKLGQGLKDGHDSVVFHSPYFAFVALNDAITQMFGIVKKGKDIGQQFGDSLKEGFSSIAEATKTANFFISEAIQQLRDLAKGLEYATAPAIEFVDVFEDVAETQRRAAAAARDLIPAEKELEGVMEGAYRVLKDTAPQFDKLGDAANKAATVTRHGASGINDAFRSINEFAEKYLPKTVAMVIDLAGTIIKVLGDLGVKLPGILGDIFNKTGSTGSTSSKSASTAGGILGGKFVEAFSAALQGAQGILSASGAPNRVSGAISGGISGAISGALIGSYFGPVGTAIGAIAGGIAGIFGGAWRSPLQKAQEAAALQEAKDAIKLSMDRVLKSAQEVIQSGITTFMKALEFFGQLDEFTKVRKEKFREFFANLSRMMDYFMELAKKFAGQSLTQLKEVADTIGPIANAIAALPAAFTAINAHFGVAQSAIDRFFSDFDKVMTAFFARADVWIEGVSKRAKKVAQRLAPAVALIADFGTALTNISGIKEPPDEVFEIFDRVIDKILVHVTELNLRFEKDVLKSMANFSEKAGFALVLWKTAIESITGMVDIKMPSAQDFANVFTAIETVISGMTAMASRLSTDALGKAEAIANASLAIFASIKAGVEALTALKDFTGVLPDVFQRFLDDFEAALTMLSSMSTRAMQFDVVAHTFESYIASGSASLSHAFTMLQQIMNAAGALFPGGSPGGETVTSASLPSSLGATSSSSSSMGTLSRGSTTTSSTTINIGSLTVAADTPERQAALQRFIDLFMPGLGLASVIGQHG